MFFPAVKRYQNSHFSQSFQKKPSILIVGIIGVTIAVVVSIIVIIIIINGILIMDRCIQGSKT